MSLASKRQDTLQPRDIASVLQALQARATAATLAGMTRYAIPATNALGVAMRDVQALAKTLGDVAKSVSMALGAIARRNSVLQHAALVTARRLAGSPDASARRVGKATVKAPAQADP